jgi:urease accessory protein
VQALTLVLSDGRFPAGGHAHSGGVEQACDEQLIGDVSELSDFLRGRLLTSGVVAAHTAAAVCAQARRSSDLTRFWSLADLESDARIQSSASRAVSRQQGGRMLRTAMRLLDSPLLDSLRDSSIDKGSDPHHAVAVGAVAASSELPPRGAAEIAAYGSVSGPASAATRLLGLDPSLVTKAVVELTGLIDTVALQASDHAHGPLRRVPSPSAPILDLLAEAHYSRKERLFAS